MSEYACTQARFLRDAELHEMSVIRDDGVHRHLRFKRPNESSYWFDLISWPGTLCIDGDMGTHVFRRLEDMFEFFRADAEYNKRIGRADQLAINPGYWGEKLRTESVYGKGHRQFKADTFRRHVREAFDNWVETSQPDEDDSTQAERDEFAEKKDHLWAALEEDVLSMADDGEIRAYDAARDFSCDVALDFNMDDCWEWNCQEYTFHFIWCCYAIAWGIKTYDLAKTPALQGGAA